MAQRRSGDWLLRLVSAAAFLAVAAVSIDAHAQNIERGRTLYENHCQVCHKADIHGRKNRMAIGIAELRDIVQRWQANQKLRWSPEEIEDVVQFLSTSRYFFTTSVGADGGRE
jgi:cytochrome c2